MKRVFVISLVLVLTLVFATAAFAQPLDPVVYGNAQSGSVSYGSFGHAWYSDGAVENGPVIPENDLLPVVVKGVYQENSGDGGKWYSYFDSRGKKHYYYVPEGTEPVVVAGVSQENSGDGGKWYSYFDSRGKKHYFYVPKGSEPVVVAGVYQENNGDDGKWYSYFNSKGNEYSIPYDNQLTNGQWEFYKDSRGVLHYFYVDPDRQGEFQRYTDQNGVKQYYYQYTD